MLFAASSILFLAIFSCSSDDSSSSSQNCRDGLSQFGNSCQSSSSGYYSRSSSSEGQPVRPPASPCGFTDDQIVSCCFADTGCTQIRYDACYFFDGIVQGCPSAR